MTVLWARVTSKLCIFENLLPNVNHNFQPDQAKFPLSLNIAENEL